MISGKLSKTEIMSQEEIFQGDASDNDDTFDQDWVPSDCKTNVQPSCEREPHNKKDESGEEFYTWLVGVFCIHHFNSTLLTIQTLTILTVYLYEKKNIQVNSCNYNKDYLRQKKNSTQIYIHT